MCSSGAVWGELTSGGRRLTLARPTRPVAVATRVAATAVVVPLLLPPPPPSPPFRSQSLERIAENAAEMAARATTELTASAAAAQENLAKVGEGVTAGWGNLNRFLDTMFAPPPPGEEASRAGGGANRAAGGGGSAGDGADGGGGGGGGSGGGDGVDGGGGGVALTTPPPTDLPTDLSASFASHFPDLTAAGEDVLDAFPCALAQKYGCMHNDATPPLALAAGGVLYISVGHAAFRAAPGGALGGAAGFGVVVDFGDVAKVQKGGGRDGMIRLLLGGGARKAFVFTGFGGGFTGALALVEHVWESGRVGVAGGGGGGAEGGGGEGGTPDGDTKGGEPTA